MIGIKDNSFIRALFQFFQKAQFDFSDLRCIFACHNYTNNDFHKDFKGIEFNLIPGNLLGGTNNSGIMLTVSKVWDIL